MTPPRGAQPLAPAPAVLAVPAWTSRARAALAALALGAVLAVGASAAPAWAHDTLTGSTPADGASVDGAPASVDLTFAQPPLALGSEVQVTGPDGEVVNAGDLVLSGTTVSQPLAPDLPAGQYVVVWRVTSADGHPISGELTFTAAGGAAAEAGDAPADDPAPTDEAVEPSPEPSATTAEPPAASPGTGTDDDAGTDGADDGGARVTPWAIGGVLLLTAGAAAGWAARRRSPGDAQG